MKGFTKLTVHLFLWGFIAHLQGQESIVLDEVELGVDSVKTYDFRSVPDQKWDVIHIDMEASFDLKEKVMHGLASLWVSPVIGDRDTLWLDARSMEIQAIEQIVNGHSLEAKYTYADDVLSIAVAEIAKPGDTLLFRIKYSAHPERAGGQGRRAIEDSKGLYFIDEEEGEEGHPAQFWTQGETSFNSSWLPVIDQPYEKITHRFFLTVDNDWVTLSNGQLAYRIENDNGTHTDVWVMDKPHAPYLAMIAAGPFSVVMDSTENGIPVHYLVEKRFEPYAQEIFGATPEMISFFSKKLGVDYPWSKYHQIVVRDYVSGAMENTSATVLGEFLYEDEYSILDSDHEDIISHELFHQWFGDLVTCRSWSDITLNEAFATYGEYLWLEHSRGIEEADLHLWMDLATYSTGIFFNGYVPIVRYEYEDPIDLFDANTYQKGARVLHQLRKVVGDDHFFNALSDYLKGHAYGAVEIDDLRRAFEKETGKDLRWFFQQWFFSPGDVDLLVIHERGPEKYTLKMQQQQLRYSRPLFKFPLVIEAHYRKDVIRKEVMVQDEWHTVDFPSSGLEFIVVDADHSLLGYVTDSGVSRESYLARIKGGDLLTRTLALDQALWKSKDPTQREEVVRMALRDEHPYPRSYGLDQIQNDPGPWAEGLKKWVRRIAEEDTDLENRAKAIIILDRVYGLVDLDLYEKASRTMDYGVATAGTIALGRIDKGKAYPMARKLFEKVRNPYRVELLEVIASKGDPDDFKMIMEYAAAHQEEMSGSESMLIKALSYYAGYGEIGGLREKAIDKLVTFKKNEDDPELASKAREALIAAVGIWKVRLKTDYLTGDERERLRKDIAEWSAKLNIP